MSTRRWTRAHQQCAVMVGVLCFAAVSFRSVVSVQHVIAQQQHLHLPLDHLARNVVLPSADCIIDAPSCILGDTCRIATLAQLRVLPALTNASVPSARVTTCAAVQQRLTHSFTGLADFAAGFVVEDGCALGHMLKDVGVVQHILRRLQQLVSTSRGASTSISFYIIWANSCATRRAWNRAHPQSSKSSSLDLFEAVIAHWWKALGVLAENNNHRKDVRLVLHHLFKDEFIRQGATSLPSAMLLFRRPLHWRWFHDPASAAELRSVMLDTFLREAPKQDAPFPELVVTIVKRGKNRRFPEHSVAALLTELLAPWHASNQTRVSVSVVALETMAFQEQLAIVSRTDIFVAAHGAALANAALLQAGRAVVVELFPANFGYWLYHELALSIGVDYFLFRGVGVSPTCRRKGCSLQRSEKDNTKMSSNKVQQLHSTLREWNGWSRCKNCDIVVCGDTAAASHVHMVDQSATASCRLPQSFEKLFEDVIRLHLFRRLRGPLPENALPVDTTLWLDRRS